MVTTLRGVVIEIGIKLLLPKMIHNQKRAGLDRLEVLSVLFANYWKDEPKKLLPRIRVLPPFFPKPIEKRKVLSYKLQTRRIDSIRKTCLFIILQRRLSLLNLTFRGRQCKQDDWVLLLATLKKMETNLVLPNQSLMSMSRVCRL